MAMSANRRSVMTLYSRPMCPQSHRVRLVLAEKGITVNIIDVGDDVLPDDLYELNPYQSVPTLIDRDLVAYNAHIVMEYLDERYPHPPLLPVDPVSRARIKLYMYRMERDWYSLFNGIAYGDAKDASEARKQIRESFTVVAPIFEQKTFFMNDELTLADCTLAPLLWRLSYFDIELPPQAKAVNKYAERLFARSAFKQGLSAQERAWRP